MMPLTKIALFQTLEHKCVAALFWLEHVLLLLRKAAKIGHFPYEGKNVFWFWETKEMTVARRWIVYIE